MADIRPHDEPETFLDLDDVTVVPATLPFDHLTAKRIVELRVDRATTQIELYAEVRGELERVEIPGGAFMLGANAPRLLLELLRLVTGARFEPLDADPTVEVWRRADVR